MKQQNYKWESIRSITPAGRAKTICIAVDAPDSLYATADGILCHNTAGDPQAPLPPAYIDSMGRMTYLDSTPEEDRDIAALFAPILEQPRPDFDKIFARAPRDIRRGAARFAQEFDGDQWLRSQLSFELQEQRKLSQGETNASTIDADDAFKGIPFWNTYSPSKKDAWKFPKFQGDKSAKSVAVSAGLDQAFAPKDTSQKSEMTKIKRVFDFFGGSGAYGLNIAEKKATNAEEVHISEFDPIRTERIKHYVTRGDRFMEDLETTGLLPIIEEIANEDQNKSNQREKALGSFGKEFDGKLQEAQTATSAGGLRGRLEKAYKSDERIRRKVNQFAERTSEFDGVNLADAIISAFIDRGSSAIGNRLEENLVQKIQEDAAKMHATAKRLRARQVKIFVYNRNAMEFIRDNKASMTSTDFIAADPPYYHTSGYEEAGDLQTNGKWNAKGYQLIHDMMRDIEDSKASYVYDDEAWWTRDDVRGLNEKTPLPDVQEAIQIFQSLRSFIPEFNIVPIPGKNKRLETLVIINKTNPNERRGLHFRQTAWNYERQQNSRRDRGERTDGAGEEVGILDGQGKGRPESTGTISQGVGDLGASDSDSGGTGAVAGQPVTPKTPPKTQDVTATKLEQDAITLSNEQLKAAKEDAIKQGNSILAEMRKLAGPIRTSYGEDAINSQRVAMFAEGDWLLHPEEDGVITGFRGESSGGIGGAGATEGHGLYIAKERSTAAFFGNVRSVNFPIPRKTLLIDEDAGRDSLPLLNEDNDALWDDILSYQETPTDSDWIKAHKRAARKVGLTNENFGQQTDAFTRALTDEMLAMGYDSTLTRSGNEEWLVILSQDGQQIERTQTESGTVLYSQAADPIERLRDLLNQAYKETARGGPRTVGDWTLAHGMDNELWMAADAYHRETMEKQSNKEWQAIADYVLAADYEAARLGLIAKFSANEHLTPPETKMAETILQREMAKPMTPEQAGRIMIFAVGLRRSRAETARTLTAMTDPHRTPIERWRAWMGETIFQPSKKARKMMKKLPTEARQRAEIDALRAKIREIEESAQQQQEAQQNENAKDNALMERAAAHIAKMEALIKQLENTPTQEAVAASDAAEKLARVEAMLAKKGVTLEDLQNGVTEVRLIGSRLIADVATTFPNRDRQIIALTQMNRGGTFADIARRFNTTEAEIEEIYNKFSERLDEELARFIRRGMTADQLDDIRYNPDQQPQKIFAQDITKGMTPEQIAELEKARIMMGFARKAEDQRRTNYHRRNSKKTNTRTKGGKVKLILMPEWTRPTGPGKDMSILLEEARQRGIEWQRPTGEGKTRGKYLDLTDNDPYEWQEGRFDPENIAERLPMIREISEAAHGSGWIDYISEYRIANLLSGLTTAFTNATAVFYSVYRSIGERAIQAGLNKMKKDKVIDAATFAEFAPFFRALGANFGRSLSNAALAFQTEMPVTENMRFHSQQDAFSGQFDEHLGRMPGEFGRFIRIPLRGLMAYDEWLKTLVAQTHAATLAHRMGRARGLTGAKMQRFIETELADPTSPIWEKALGEARRQTFQTKLRSMFESDAKRKSGEFSPLRRKLDALENFAKMLQSFKQDTGSDAGMFSLAAVFMLRWQAPFIKTPFNLLKRGLELTPLSVVVHGYDALGLQRYIASPAATTAKSARKKIARLQKDLRAARTKEAKDRVQKELDAAKRSFEEARQQIAKDGNKGRLKIPKDEKKILESRSQIIASAIATMVFASISEGDEDDDDKWALLTGSFKPDTLATRGGRNLERRTAPPYSLRIGGPGGLLLSYQRIDPFSTAIATVVDATAEMKRAIRSGQAFRPSVVMSGIYKQFTERASTQGFADAVDVATGKKSIGAKEIAESIGQSITPNIVRSFLRNQDEYYRDTESFGEDFLAHLIYAMWPSSSTDLPPKLDIYGEPIERPGAFISRYLVPAQPHMQPEYRPGDVTMRNFALQNPDLEIWAPEAPSTPDTMRRYNVSARTAYRINQARGQIFARKLREQRLTNIRQPTPSQIDEIRKAHKDALDDAKKSVGIK